MQALLFATVASFSLSVLGAILADHYLAERIAIVGDFMGLQYSVNPGIAWGLRLPEGIQDVAILGALLVVAVLAIRTARNPLSAVRCPLSAFGLILGGGLANVVDRLRDGVVTDYFQVGTFPIFNVADSCVSIGVVLLLCEWIRARRNPKS